MVKALLGWWRVLTILGTLYSLHQITRLAKDCQSARGKYINKAVGIREELFFARPEQIMQAVQILSTDAYGSMLWSLSSAEAESYFKCWNTCVKLVHGIPRSSYTYLVEGHFAAGQASLRSQVISRYPGFFRGLFQSPSKEVRVLARIVETDPRSTTCLNLRYMSQITGLNKPEYYRSAKIREALPPKMVPDSESGGLD